MKATNLGMAITVIASLVFAIFPTAVSAQIQTNGQSFNNLINTSPNDLQIPQSGFPNQMNGLGGALNNLIKQPDPSPIDSNKLLYNIEPPLQKVDQTATLVDQTSLFPKISLDNQGDIILPPGMEDKITVNSDEVLKLKINQDQLSSNITDIGERVSSLEVQLSARLASQEAKIEQIQKQVATNTSGIEDLKQAINNMINIQATESGQTKPYFSGPMIPADSLMASDSAKPQNLKGSDKVLGLQFNEAESTLSGTLAGLNEPVLYRTSANTRTVSELSAVGDSKIKSIDFFGSLVSIDSLGEITAKTLLTDELKFKANKSAGEVSLPKGKTEVVVPNQLVQANSIIFASPEIPLSQVAAAVNKIPGKSFTIRVLKPELTDVDFSYVIIGITP